MPESAHVSSVEALEDFRASLIIYLSKARPTLEEVSSDVVRTRTWLENEQRMHWENQVRRRAKQLEQARQTLFGAQLSNLREATDAERLAVQRAQRSLEEAEAKLRRVKQWSREYDSRVEPMAKQLDQMLDLLATLLPKATAHLAQTIKTLAEYTGLKPAYDASSPARSGDVEATTGGDATQAGAGGLPSATGNAILSPGEPS